MVVLYRSPTVKSNEFTQETILEINYIFVFVVRPIKRVNTAQGFFKGGSSRQAVVQTHPTASKIPRAPSAFPLNRGPRHQAINLVPPRKVRACGDAPRRLEESRSRDVNARLPRHPR